MTNKALVLAAAGAFGLLGAMAATPEEEDAHPISENIRGHENTEWSTSYAWHLTDEKKTLPRVLLIGDSICQDYSSRVVAALEGKMTITYWVSCFGFAAPCYMQFLSIYLDEAEYAVIQHRLSFDRNVARGMGGRACGLPQTIQMNNTVEADL